MEGLQDHEIKCALQNFGLFAAHGFSFGRCKEDSSSPLQCPKGLFLGSDLKICRPRFVVRRDWNFAEVEFGGHGSVMVRRGCHLGKKGGHAALSKVPVPSDNKFLTTNLAPLNSIPVDRQQERPLEDH
jgi:hypothetical protein